MLLSHLPIEQDHDEDATVYSCLSYLLHDDLDAPIKVQIISLFVKVIEMEKVEQGEIKLLLMAAFKSRSAHYILSLRSSNLSKGAKHPAVTMIGIKAEQ